MSSGDSSRSPTRRRARVIVRLAPRRCYCSSNSHALRDRPMSSQDRAETPSQGRDRSPRYGARGKRRAMRPDSPVCGFTTYAIPSPASTLRRVARCCSWRSCLAIRTRNRRNGTRTCMNPRSRRVPIAPRARSRNTCISRRRSLSRNSGHGTLPPMRKSGRAANADRAVVA
jgi:hypothetical protein